MLDIHFVDEVFVGELRIDSGRVSSSQPAPMAPILPSVDPQVLSAQSVPKPEPVAGEHQESSSEIPLLETTMFEAKEPDQSDAATTTLPASLPDGEASGNGDGAPITGATQEPIGPQGSAGAPIVSAPPSDSPKTSFLPVYRVDKPPQFIQQAPISYPRRARDLGIEGTVFLEALIDENGVIVDVQVSRGIGYGLDEEALRMIRDSTFSPASVKEKPVGVKMLLRVKFSLK